MADCKKHSQCRKVKGTGSFYELIDCPWCGYKVSTSNFAKWCSGCYVKFKVVNGWVHFSKGFKKTPAECLAIALEKTGGAKFGDK